MTKPPSDPFEMFANFSLNFYIFINDELIYAGHRAFGSLCFGYTYLSTIEVFFGASLGVKILRVSLDTDESTTPKENTRVTFPIIEYGRQLVLSAFILPKGYADIIKYICVLLDGCCLNIGRKISDQSDLLRG